MTLEEKAAMLHASGRKVVGDQTWQVHVKGIERLGIPDLTMADGSTGLRGGTQLPAPIALGASFDVEAARKYGDLLGAETRAMGYGVLLAPTVNLARDPRHGRTFEGFGEDPFLIGTLAVPQTTAIQAHDVIADAKHLAVNNVENDRETLDVSIDERVLNELYLPHFKDVVMKTDLGSLMCSFNKINGVHACDDDDLLNRLLRDRWGFKGFVRTDANAHHTMKSVEHGLDQELPNSWTLDDDLVKAVRDGQVSERAVDTAVTRILRTMVKSGVYDNPPERTGVDVQDGLAKAQELAEDGIVLLRNQNNALPLKTPQKVAVIGADAANTATYGGGSANIKPAVKDTILDAIRQRVPGTTYAPGVDPIGPASVLPGYDVAPSSVMRANDGTPGLTASYYREPDFTNRIAQRVEPCVCIDDGWYADGGTVILKPPGKPRSARWTGTITAPADGTYSFDLSSFDSAQLFINNEKIIDNSGTHPATPKSGNAVLKAGQPLPIKIDYVIAQDNDFVDVSRKLKLGWQPPAEAQDPAIAQAAQTAKDAEVAIVVVRDYASEATDRTTLALPNSQDALVAAVAKAQPNTIVVLTTGSAVAMPWADQVPAIVEAWYGGSAGGAALARVLFGDVDPGGHLPITFPRSHEDLQTAAKERFPGIDRLAVYGEGMKVGYRGVENPLYAFGHGLSYTSFSYEGLALDRSAFVAGAAADHGGFDGRAAVTASFTVKNTGARYGEAVPQVYVQRQLKGFQKVRLAPGESKRVTIALDQQAFAVYEPKADQWRIPQGDFTVEVADSAITPKLTAKVKVRVTQGAPRVELQAPALGATVVRGTVVNDGTLALNTPKATLAVPEGWTVTGGRLPATIAAGQSAPVEWRIGMPATPPGDYKLTATLRFAKATSRTTATVRVPYPDLNAARNNAGVTDDAAVTTGDLDGRGHTLSAQALAAKGFTPGARVEVGGATYTWAAANVATYGQTVRLNGRGNTLNLLVTSTGERTAGRFTVLYTDGSSAETVVRAPDWWRGGEVTFPYVNAAQPLCAGGTLDGTKCVRDVGLSTVKVPLDPAKEVAGVVLPTLAPTPVGPVATMHLFAMEIQ
ncbi:glycoside hydrolase family 3 C-terminal domain-containing protein [Nonomuraea sp. NPDC050556]|uniref:glycoside hydrolase family 3 C-terminal domain-containing protein n=1 Tax=Nonomuraea sp. NPDC050556 TaxID=3364369 RepID=UPI0037B46A3E